MTTKQALSGALQTGSFASYDLLDTLQLGRAEVVTQTANWAENVARFLTDPVVSGLLMSLGMLGLLLELYTPGFGFAGGLGLMCLMMFFGGHMVTNIAGWEEVALFGVGLLALGAEVFIIPGFGIAGVLGLGLIGIALAMSMVGLPISTSWDVGVLQGGSHNGHHFLGDHVDRSHHHHPLSARYIDRPLAGARNHVGRTLWGTPSRWRSLGGFVR